MNIESLLDLCDHMAWADAEVWTAVLACDQACESAKLRDTLQHLHTTQRVYLRIWRGEPMDAPLPQFEKTSALLVWARAHSGEVRAYVESLTEAQLREPIPETWAQRVEGFLGRARTMPTLGDTVLQVPLHSLYHRGQANARLRELGGTPPLVDHIAWVWFGRPAASWPTVAGEGAP